MAGKAHDFALSLGVLLGKGLRAIHGRLTLGKAIVGGYPSQTTPRRQALSGF
jgi:hypothetical protein